MSVSVISPLPYDFGEGPHWDEATKSLLFMDVINGNIHRWNSLTKEETKIHLDGYVTFAIPRRSGGLMSSQYRNFVHVTESPVTVTPIGQEVDPGTNNFLNDAKCDAAGRIWSGTFCVDEITPPKYKSGVGSLYSLDRDLSIKKHIDNLDVSNGMAWTADNKTMFFIDYGPRKVYAFDFDLSNGSVTNKQVAIAFSKDTVEEIGSPDGMTIDTNDKLWVACHRGGKIIQFDPETGKQLRAVAIPAKGVTSCCFGGQNYDELYVTSERHYDSDENLKALPLSGCTFKVTGLGVKGKAPFIFEG